MSARLHEQHPLNTLCDPRAIQDLLSPRIEPAGGAALQARVERVWPDRACGARFEWTVAGDDGGRHSVFGVPLERSRRDDAQVGRIDAFGVRGLSWALPEFGLLLHGADTDPRLPQLGACLDPARAAGFLASFAGGTDCVPAITLLGHKPGRRAAIRYDLPTPGRRIAGKTFRDDRGPRFASWQASIAGQLAERGSGTRVPIVIGVHEPLRLLLIDWAEGRPVESSGGAAPADSLAAMTALADLHAISVEPLARHTPLAEIEIGARWMELLAQLDPRRATRGTEMLEQLRAWAERLTPLSERVIHRDFYEAQVIRRPDGGVTILDLDTLCAGDPAQDVGNYLAHLALARGDRVPNRDEADCLCAAYAKAGGEVIADNVAYYWASSLLRGGAIHALRAATRAHAAGLWSMAGALLGEARPRRRAV